MSKSEEFTISQSASGRQSAVCMMQTKRNETNKRLWYLKNNMFQAKSEKRNEKREAEAKGSSISEYGLCATTAAPRRSSHHPQFIHTDGKWSFWVAPSCVTPFILSRVEVSHTVVFSDLYFSDSLAFLVRCWKHCVWFYCTFVLWRIVWHANVAISTCSSSLVDALFACVDGTFRAPPSHSHSSITQLPTWCMEVLCELAHAT